MNKKKRNGIRTSLYIKRYLTLWMCMQQKNQLAGAVS